MGATPTVGNKNDPLHSRSLKSTMSSTDEKLWAMFAGQRARDFVLLEQAGRGGSGGKRRLNPFQSGP